MSDLVSSNSRYWLGMISSVIFFSSHQLLVSTYSFAMGRSVIARAFGEGVGGGGRKWGSYLKLNFREQENFM